MKQRSKRYSFTLVAVVMAMALCLLPGCLGAPAANTAQSENVAYMSKAHSSMEELTETLDAFNEAVARQDIVTMRTQAENANRVIDAFTAIEAPEVLADVRQDYVDGCVALQGALSDYVALYGDISSATPEHPFDYSTYDGRIQAIQKAYDEGIQMLQSGDQRAIDLENE